MTADPVVVALRVNRRQLEVTCPHCGMPHRHGAPSPSLGSNDGHRLAHCHTDGLHSGYVLHEVSHGHYAVDVHAENKEATR